MHTKYSLASNALAHADARCMTSEPTHVTVENSGCFEQDLRVSAGAHRLLRYEPPHVTQGHLPDATRPKRVQLDAEDRRRLVPHTT